MNRTLSAQIFAAFQESENGNAKNMIFINLLD